MKSGLLVYSIPFSTRKHVIFLYLCKKLTYSSWCFWYFDVVKCYLWKDRHPEQDSLDNPAPERLRVLSVETTTVFTSRPYGKSHAGWELSRFWMTWEVSTTVPASESWCKGRNAPSLGSLVVDEERMRPDGDFPWSVFGALTVLVVWQNWYPAHKRLYDLFWKFLFCNKWGKKTSEELANQYSPGKELLRQSW